VVDEADHPLQFLRAAGALPDRFGRALGLFDVVVRDAVGSGIRRWPAHAAAN
jgi:hypothetical protein